MYNCWVLANVNMYLFLSNIIYYFNFDSICIHTNMFWLQRLKLLLFGLIIFGYFFFWRRIFILSLIIQLINWLIILSYGLRCLKWLYRGQLLSTTSWWQFIHLSYLLQLQLIQNITHFLFFHLVFGSQQPIASFICFLILIWTI